MTNLKIIILNITLLFYNSYFKTCQPSIRREKNNIRDTKLYTKKLY